MKVLHVNAVLDIGSTGNITRDIHELSIAHGIESRVAYSIASKKSDLTNTYRIGSYMDHKLHALLSRISENQASFSNISTNAFIKYVSDYKPDIVQFHNVHANFINIYKFLGYLAEHDIAVIVTLHDCWFFTGGCTHYTKFDCDKWLKNCGNCPIYSIPGMRPALFDATSRNRGNKFNALSKIKNLCFVGVSNWVVSESHRFGLPNAKYATVYNGIDFNIFKPVNSDLRRKLGLDGKFVILGPNDKWMQPMNIDNLKLLAEKLGDEYAIVLFGGGPKREDLPANVMQYGYTHNRQEMVSLYSTADVFVNSTRQDTLSLVNVEAQACGTPIITYRNTGAQETVDGINSFSVPNDDIDSLILKIGDIKKYGKKKYSQGCVSWVHKMFDKSYNYLKYIEIYKELKS